MERQRQRTKHCPPDLTIMTLPVDLLQLVLGFLGVVDIAQWLRPVCRASRALVARCATVSLKHRCLNAQAVQHPWFRQPLEKVFAHTPQLRLLRLDHVFFYSCEMKMFKLGPTSSSALLFFCQRFHAACVWVRSALGLCVELERSAAAST